MVSIIWKLHTQNLRTRPAIVMQLSGDVWAAMSLRLLYGSHGRKVAITETPSSSSLPFLDPVLRNRVFFCLWRPNHAEPCENRSIPSVWRYPKQSGIDYSIPDFTVGKTPE